MSARPEIKVVEVIESADGQPLAVLRVSHPASMSIFTFVINCDDMMTLRTELDEAFFAFENRPKGLGDDR